MKAFRILSTDYWKIEFREKIFSFWFSVIHYLVLQKRSDSYDILLLISTILVMKVLKVENDILICCEMRRFKLEFRGISIRDKHLFWCKYGHRICPGKTSNARAGQCQCLHHFTSLHLPKYNPKFTIFSSNPPYLLKFQVFGKPEKPYAA